MYDYYPSPPSLPRSSRWRGPLLFLAAIALVAVGVGVYVFLNRLSNDVLTVIATVGCAAGVALPALLLALVVLLRRAENGRKHEYTPTPMTQPTVMVIPPMAVPPQIPYQPQTPAAWDTAPTRRFTIVGEE